MFYPTKLIFSLTVIIRAIFNEVLTEELAKEPVNVGYTLFVNLPRAEDLSPNKLFEVVLIFSTSDEPTLPSSVCEGGRELSMGYMLATPADEDNSSLTPLQSFKWRANFCPGEGTFLKNYISNITFSKVDTKVFFGDFTLKENVFMGTEETGTFFDADVSQNRFFKIDTFNDKTLATLGKLVSYFNFIATRNDKPSDYAETFDDNSSNGSNDPVVPKLSEAPDFKLFEIKKGSAFLKKREMNEFLKGAKLAFEEEDSSNQDDECTCKCTCSCGMIIMTMKFLMKIVKAEKKIQQIVLAQRIIKKTKIVKTMKIVIVVRITRITRIMRVVKMMLIKKRIKGVIETLW
eukprot:GAHX01000708.1.p1 GENE.GAHX01000708.1~~GAHX01000708.1.p1  ORF type:complete len:354 (-),score=66.49 GAHX01000708.1:25-1062(-)